MIALRDEPKIISMAHTLGIHAGDTVEGIREFCRRKVQALVAAGSRAPRSIEDLERLVCERLHIEIVEVWNDDDLNEVIEKYARREKEPSFGVLRRDLDDETFATLIQRKRPPGQQAYHYVAVIDCRGEKSARRFFTRWHEIAHVLTLVGQLELPLHRSTVRKDPVEKMMDLIAGDIGFFEPLFQPVFNAECAGERVLSFVAVEKVRATFCPAASLEATLHACANQFASPVILLQAAFGYRAEVQRLLAAGQGDLFPGDPPAPPITRAGLEGESSGPRGEIDHPEKHARACRLRDRHSYARNGRSRSVPRRGRSQSLAHFQRPSATSRPGADRGNENARARLGDRELLLAPAADLF